MSRSVHCYCLNIVVHYSGELTANEVINCREIDANVQEDKELIQITLETPGIVTEHTSLVQPYKLTDSWTIYRCINCSIDVYAIKLNSEQHSIFVFSNLRNTSSQQLKEDPNYSPLYKIVLKHSSGIETQTRKQMLSSGEDKVLKLLDSQMKRYLDKSEKEMNERIKAYEQQQKEEFKKLQKKCYEDRRRIFSAIYTARDSGTNTDTNNSSSNSDDVTRIKPKETKTTQKTSSTVKQISHHTELTNDTDMFNFDEDLLESDISTREVDSTPFPLSSSDEDYDSSSLASSLSSEDKFRVKTLLPASLPLSMPFLSNRSSDTVSVPKSPPTDPNEVALSIQKLALSVQDTGMFGDLPRPRVNSRR